MSNRRDILRLRRAQRLARGFDGAQHDRLSADWVLGGSGPNEVLRYSLSTLRARCRDLERNNDHVRAFLRALQKNVVGPRGIGLQMRVKNEDGTPDRNANARIEAAWQAWGRRGVCTMDGRLSWAEAQRLFIRTVARDGEVIVRLVRGKAAGNDYGFAIQLLEADHLDEQDDRDLPGGRRVRAGVEVDAWGRPLALHIWRDHPGEQSLFGRGDRRKLRLPMRDVLHCYVVERPAQLRGYPWLASAITRLRQLGKYEEAELIAARLAASKMGFYKLNPEAYPENIATVSQDGELLTEVAPGQFEELPPGYEFQPFDPQHPNTAFAAFQKSMLQSIAAGIGVSYASLSSDLSQANYSSLRQGALEERDEWRVLQRWMIDAFIRPVFVAWLEMAMTTGAVPLPMSKWDKFARPTFHPRGWEWVDPLKEVNAAIAALEMGLDTRSRLLAAKGIDFEELLSDMAAERVLEEEYGVTLPAARPKGVPVAPDDGGENA